MRQLGGGPTIDVPLRLVPAAQKLLPPVRVVPRQNREEVQEHVLHENAGEQQQGGGGRDSMVRVQRTDRNERQQAQFTRVRTPCAIVVILVTRRKRPEVVSEP